MKIKNLIIYTLMWLAISVFTFHPWEVHADNPKMTSAGSTFNRGDFTSTNAFFLSSLDLSQLAGIDTGSARNYIVVVDGTGKTATGYLAGVGAGETLSTEQIIDNWDFAAQGSWNFEDGTITIAGGKGVFTATSSGKSLYQVGALSSPINKLVKTVFTIDSISGGTLRFLLSNAVNFTVRVSAGTYTDYKTDTSTNGQINIITGGGVNSTASVDNASVKFVIDPPSTAVHIVSSLNGTTRAWESIESGFNPNDIASWTIYGSPTTTRIFDSRGPIESGMINSGPINSGMIR